MLCTDFYFEQTVMCFMMNDYDNIKYWNIKNNKRGHGMLIYVLVIGVYFPKSNFPLNDGSTLLVHFLAFFGLIYQ